MKSSYFLKFNQSSSLVLIMCLIILMSFPLPVFSGLQYHHSFNYHSTTDNVEQFSYATMRNYLFFGATLGKSDRFVLGQSVAIWNKSHKAGSTGTPSDLNLLELGPRMTFYIDESKIFALNAAYHPYAKGKRTLPPGSSQTISGSSYFLNLSSQVKITKTFFVGAAINYHSITIAEAIEDNQESKVNHTYSYIFPSIDFSLRFK